MNLQNPIKTPAGSSSSAAGVLYLILNVILPPVWPWWHHQSTGWIGAVGAVITFTGTYLASWLKIVLSKNQKVTMELTPSRLPTVQQEAPAPAKV